MLFISHSAKDQRWAKKVSEYLKTVGYGSLFVAWHPDDGIHAGADWEKELYQNLRRARGVVVLCSANWLKSPWCLAEAIITREQGKRLFIIASRDITDGRYKNAQTKKKMEYIPDFLADKQVIYHRDATMHQVFASLVHGLQEEGLNKRIYPLPKIPYPGLEPFTEYYAAVYFGRDDEADDVIDTLRRRMRNNANGFILVLGASGCGKSSLVRAGVLPRLKIADVNEGLIRTYITLEPFMAGTGKEGLANSLLTLGSNLTGQASQLASFRSRLSKVEDFRELCRELASAKKLGDAKILVVIDQLEEVFATTDGSDARTTLRLLLDASADPSSPVVVLATMRSDFLNAFQHFEGAAMRYEKITLDPMPREKFHEVIDGPAACFGLEIEPRLIERIRDDTTYEDALPLLSFTMHNLYVKCAAQKRLTHNAYESLGGVSGAVKQCADQILASTGYADLSPDNSELHDLRRALFRLVDIGDEGQFTRRIALWSEMPPSCHPVLERFIGERLLVSTPNEQGHRTVRVSHEALFRVWDTLRDWLRQDRKTLFLREQINDAANEWNANSRHESHAWSDKRIVDAVRKISRSGISLGDDPLISAFIGPTSIQELTVLPTCTEDDDLVAGSGRYGENWRLPLSHQARASVGVRLALLGDPRPGIGLREDGLPDIEWCQVEGGEVNLHILASTGNPNADCVKTLVSAVQSFSIGRYPITVDQFQAFVRECYRDGVWCLPTEFRFEMPHSTPPQHRVSYGNYPADGVSWWDAVAFCHWLSDREGVHIRLPTEFEWQLAATAGNEDRVYPWGSVWDPDREPWRANTSESGLNCPTAVGLYPLGVSKTGVFDMAGTVWEWCWGVFADPTCAGTPQNEKRERVLRGGSWVNHQDHARSRNRLSYNPLLRHDNVGFRVVCASPLLL